MDIRPKVLVTKIGLDGHDRGSRIVAAYLRDAGMGVIYTPPGQEIPAVVKLATEEDVDVIALSRMAGSHLSFCARLKPLLEKAGLADKLWIIGGNLPAQDHAQLAELGFKGIFPTGSKLGAIVDYIRDHVR